MLKTLALCAALVLSGSPTARLPAGIDLRGKWIATLAGERGTTDVIIDIDVRKPDSAKVIYEGHWTADTLVIVQDRVPSHDFTGVVYDHSPLEMVLGPRCCDAGELFLKGTAQGDSITGSWSQMFYGGGPQGAFVMRRKR